MLEDMAAAVEWLGSVTLRFVRWKRRPATGAAAPTPPGAPSGAQACVGSSQSRPGVWCRRASDGGLVVDLEVDAPVAVALDSAAAVAAADGAAAGAASPEGGRAPGDAWFAAPGRTDALRADDGVEAGDGSWALAGTGPAGLVLVGVLFQQGINEQQAVANATGATGLQGRINAESLARTGRYLTAYKAAAAAQAAAAAAAKTAAAGSAAPVAASASAAAATTVEASPRKAGRAKPATAGAGVGEGAGAAAAVAVECAEWDALFEAARAAVEAPHHRSANVHVVLASSDLCRALTGIHGICCKVVCCCHPPPPFPVT